MKIGCLNRLRASGKNMHGSWWGIPAPARAPLSRMKRGKRGDAISQLRIFWISRLIRPGVMECCSWMDLTRPRHWRAGQPSESSGSASQNLDTHAFGLPAGPGTGGMPPSGRIWGGWLPAAFRFWHWSRFKEARSSKFWWTTTGFRTQRHSWQESRLLDSQDGSAIP